MNRQFIRSQNQDCVLKHEIDKAMKSTKWSILPFHEVIFLVYRMYRE